MTELDSRKCQLLDSTLTQLGVKNLTSGITLTRAPGPNGKWSWVMTGAKGGGISMYSKQNVDSDMFSETSVLPNQMRGGSMVSRNNPVDMFSETSVIPTQMNMRGGSMVSRNNPSDMFSETSVLGNQMNMRGGSMLSDTSSLAMSMMGGANLSETSLDVPMNMNIRGGSMLSETSNANMSMMGGADLSETSDIHLNTNMRGGAYPFMKSNVTGELDMFSVTSVLPMGGGGKNESESGLYNSIRSSEINYSSDSSLSLSLDTSIFNKPSNKNKNTHKNQQKGGYTKSSNNFKSHKELGINSSSTSDVCE
jgi:hypothetical protein